MKASDSVDLVVGIVADTEKALLVTTTGFEADAVWVPKALIDLVARLPDDPGEAFDLWRATMPAWKAIEAGLIDREFL
ncbi:MAG: hypothetical protein GC206_13345 [Alphaproteobacteria bacterium]|nr:hypothetical protein [Alphaproteobacteria bacterium]